MQCCSSCRFLDRLSKPFFCFRHLTTDTSPSPALLSAAYTNLLKTCAESSSLPCGKSIHAQILATSFKPSLFLLNNLLNMYCKCGDLENAYHLFDRMPRRDIVSWNSLITGHSQLRQFYAAMQVFVDALKSAIKVDRFTFASMLNVCARSKDLRAGEVVHGMVVASGMSKRVFMSNSLIDMYAKCGKVNKAQRVFDSADVLDDVSWNLLLSMYVRIGSHAETLRIFRWMCQLGVEISSFALGSVLKSCSSLDDSKELGRMIHGCVIKVGLDLDVFMGSALLDMYAKNGLLNEAVKVFKLLPDPNVVVFNAMIAGFCRSDMEEGDDNTFEALSLFFEMRKRGLAPTKFSFSSVLRACTLTEAFEFGKQVHGHIVKDYLQEDEFIGSALIDLYSNSGSIEYALKCFHSVPKQDIVTWTSMISGCVQNEHFEKAISLFHELLRHGLKPDQFTMSCVMSSCANLAAVRSGEQIQSYSTKAGLDWLTIYCNSQIFMYARSGDVDAAERTFQEMENRDVVSWSAIISSHAQYGSAKEALKLFKEMEESLVIPNHVTFLGLLTACSHGGLVDEGFRYYKTMKSDYGIIPNVKHCACVVDLLGRAGRLPDAEKFILDSGFDDDPVMWRALLGSCRVHGDIERGTCVAKRIMELEPGASASYVLLYNMYLDSGRKPLALRTRELMKERGVKKEPGLSWIEIGPSVHSFVAGDKSHSQAKAIYAKLEDMLSKIEMRCHTDSLTIDLEHFKEDQKAKLMNCHSEKLAVSLGMICLPNIAPIRVMKNLRVCVDCHTTMKLFSEIEGREIILRDPVRFHRFRCGSCSCGDYW